MKYKDLNEGQKKRFVFTFLMYLVLGIVIITLCSVSLHSERQRAHRDWDNYLSDSPEQIEQIRELSKDATKVRVGTYVENLREINMKSSYFRVEFLAWFSWEGDETLDPASNCRVYKGIINKQRLVQEYHEGNSHYQLVSMDVSVSKNFETKRFPLESHQMRFYIESTDPIQKVVYEPDYANSGLNRNLTITGYEFLRHAIGSVSYTYDSNHGDPTIDGGEVSSEIVTAFEINRSSFGMYFKCFIALAGTVGWVLIALFICTYHHVDPLGMIPGALFGAVGNIMIGANLLPDALEMGLLEYVNIWGVLCILGGAIAIININRVRNNYEDREFAHYYGRMLFYTMLIFSIGGQVILPLMAYA